MVDLMSLCDVIAEASKLHGAEQDVKVNYFSVWSSI